MQKFENFQQMLPEKKSGQMKNRVAERGQLKGPHFCGSITKIKEIKERFIRDNLIYQSGEFVYKFKYSRTIQACGRAIANGEIMIKEVDKIHEELENKKNNFNCKVRP